MLGVAKKSQIFVWPLLSEDRFWAKYSRAPKTDCKRPFYTCLSSSIASLIIHWLLWVHSDRRGNCAHSGHVISSFLTQASSRLYEIRQPTYLYTTSNFLTNTRTPQVLSRVCYQESKLIYLRSHIFSTIFSHFVKEVRQIKVFSGPIRSFLSWLHGRHQFPFPASKFRVLLAIGLAFC